MGYSYTKAADDRLIALMAYSVLASSNTWKNGDTVYFYESGDTQDDGAIVGIVYEVSKDPEAAAKDCGPFRIEPDGTVAAFPCLNDKQRTMARGLPPKFTGFTKRANPMPLFKIASAPIGETVLLYWDASKHIEDGTIYEDGDSESGLYHVLFDGESLNTEPTHWAPLPDFKPER